MIVLADGLFRLDVTIFADTLRTIVRNLSPGELTMHSERARSTEATIALGNSADYRPTQSTTEFSLGDGPDRVEVSVLLATLRFAGRGNYQVTSQATIRSGVDAVAQDRTG
jgi:hypothetical protein